MAQQRSDNGEAQASSNTDAREAMAKVMNADIQKSRRQINFYGFGLRNALIVCGYAAQFLLKYFYQIHKGWIVAGRPKLYGCLLPYASPWLLRHSASALYSL